MALTKPFSGKFIFSTILIVLSLNLAIAADSVGFRTRLDSPEMDSFVPKPPAINASSYILVDTDSGEILASKDPDTQLPPASLTKLMTIYVLFDALEDGLVKLDDNVRVSKKAWKTGGSRMFIKAGDEVSVEDLIQGIIVASGNDASVAIAEYLAGSEEAFTALMNQHAKVLGMNHSHFTDATGLPDTNHYSTASDIAKLSRAIQIRFPQYQHYFQQKWYNYANIKQPNRNRLLWRDDYITGLKTGHTEEAGYCLAASANKDGMRLTSVVMGTPSDSARTDDTQRLLTYAYRFFETYQLYRQGNEISRTRIYGGQQKTVSLGLAEPLYITIPREQRDDIKTTIKFNTPLEAPIAKGQSIATLFITLNDKTVAQAPLVALTDNPKGGVWRRMSDAISQKWHHWFGRDEDAS